MKSISDLYINRVLHYAELPAERGEEVRLELEDHLTQRIRAEREKGRSEEEAILSAIRSMGHPRRLGQQFARPFRWIDIRSHGTARGVIAMGPRAVGVVAFGGISMGVVAIGGIGIGVISLSGLGLGLITWAGVSVGLIASGGVAVGAVAAGAMALGLIAVGGPWAAGLAVLNANQSHSYYAAGKEPEWLRQLAPLLEVPEFIMKNMAAILPLYLLVLAIGTVTQWIHQRKNANGSMDDWLYD